ncbi:MAG: metal ABC transporter permease [Desulfarculales bacterium]|nr:metal ABC transporter permease [Desulfarculales bacterium]
MLEFLQALTQYNFLGYALAGGLLASLSCGVVSAYVVSRRLTYLAGAIAHCVLAGLGGARYAQVRWGILWLDPLYGALLTALLAALIIGWVSLRARQREDSIIGSLWALGMAGGVLFLAATPGYETDLMNYLFGNILLLDPASLWLMLGLAGLVLILGLGLYPELLAVCADEEFARLRGLNTEFYYLLLLAMTSLTVVLLSSLVGLVLVIALLTLPAALASLMARRLRGIIVISIIACALFNFSGLCLSYLWDLPSGAVTVMVAGTVYLCALLVSKILKTRHSDGS